MGLVDDLLKLAQSAKPPENLVATSYVRVIWHPRGAGREVTYAPLVGTVTVPIGASTDHKVRVTYTTAPSVAGKAQLAVMVERLRGNDTRALGDVRVEAYIGLRDPADTSNAYTFYVFTCDSSDVVPAGCARRVAAGARELPDRVTVRAMPGVGEPGFIGLDVGVDVREQAAPPLAVEYGYLVATVTRRPAYDGTQIDVVHERRTSYTVPVLLERPAGGDLHGTLFEGAFRVDLREAPPAPSAAVSGRGAVGPGAYTYRCAYVVNGVEGPAGDPSPVVRIAEKTHAEVTVTTYAAAGPEGDAMRVYRSRAGDETHRYWVADLAAAERSFVDSTPDGDLAPAYAPARRASLRFWTGPELHVEVRVAGTGLPDAFVRLEALTGAVTAAYADPATPEEHTVEVDTSSGIPAVVEGAAAGLGMGDFDALLASVADLPPYVGLTLDAKQPERSFVAVRTAPPRDDAVSEIGGLQVVLARTDRRELEKPRHALVVETGKGFLRLACTGLRHAAYATGAPHPASGATGFARDGLGRWVEVDQTDRTDYGLERAKPGLFPGRGESDPRVTPRSLRMHLAGAGAAYVDVRAISVDPLENGPVVFDQRSDGALPFGLIVHNAAARGIRVRTQAPRRLVPLEEGQTLLVRVPAARSPLRVALQPEGDRQRLVVETPRPVTVAMDLTTEGFPVTTRVAGRFDISGSIGSLTFKSGAYVLGPLTTKTTVSGRLSVSTGVVRAPVVATTENPQVRDVDGALAVRAYDLRSLDVTTSPLKATVSTSGPTARSFRYAMDGRRRSRVVVPRVPSTITLELGGGSTRVVTNAALTGGWAHLLLPATVGDLFVAFDVEAFPTSVALAVASGVEPSPMFTVGTDEFTFSATRLTLNGRAEVRRLLIGGHARRFGAGLTFAGGGLGGGWAVEDEWTLAAGRFVTVEPGGAERTLALWSGDEHWDDPKRKVVAALDTGGAVVDADLDSLKALLAAAPALVFAKTTWTRSAEIQAKGFDGWWRIGPGDHAESVNAGLWFVRAAQPLAAQFNVSSDIYFGNTPGGKNARDRIYP